MMPANIAAATLPQILAASAVGGAVPFAVYGMLENNPLIGAAKGAAFGAVLGAGKAASGLIANSLARWTARVVGGAGLGAGGAALEGADSHEMMKQAILFAVMEAFGPPGVNENIKVWLKSKGVTDPAASGMVNTFNDLVSKLKKDQTIIEEGETAKVIADAAKAGKQLPMEDVTRLAGMEREAQITGFGGHVPEGMEGIPQRDYPSTIVPTTQEVTKGKGKKAKTTKQLAFEEAHPEEAKLTGLGPEATELYLRKAAEEREAKQKEAGTQWSREKGRFLDEPLEIDKAPVIFDFGESTAPEARRAIVEQMFPKGKQQLAMNAVMQMPPEMTAGEVVGRLKEIFPNDAADAMVLSAGRIRFSAGGPERDSFNEKVHTLDITPQMKDSVLYEGQPMFRDSKGKAVPQVVNEQTLRAAFGEESGAQISKPEHGDWLVQLPNGANIRVYPNSEIVVDPKAWFMAYKRPYAGEELYGTWRNLNYGGVIQLAKEGPRGVLRHEVFHGAMDLALMPSEREAILRKYGTEEKAARVYEDWNPLEKADTLFGKIHQFFQQLWRGLFPGAEEAFQKIRSGEVWAEKPAMRAASEQPMRYSALTDEWNKLKEGPKLGRPSEGAKQAHNTLLKALQRAWVPETMDQEAMGTAQAYTARFTDARAAVVRAAKVVNDYRVQFHEMGKDAAYTLNAKMERKENVPAEWKPYAEARGQFFDASHKELSRIKDGHVGYIENYAPHLCADPEKAARFYDSIGQRPLEGSKGFLKQRRQDLPTWDELRANGIEPRFDNPAEQDLAGLMEQRRFIAANDFISDLEQSNPPMAIPLDSTKSKYAKPTAPVPDGWVKADLGFWKGYVPRNAADVINNHLKSEAGGLWFNKYKNITAMWNAWHVTLSAFHGMTTMVHGLSMGAWQPIPDLLGAIAAGDHAAAAQALKRVGPMGVVNMFKIAKQGKQEFFTPGTHGRKIATLVDIATKGGALPESTVMHGMAAESFKEMFQQLKGGDIGPAFRSMTYLLGKPIMGYLVPTVKYGSTLLRIEREMDTLQRRYNQKYGSEWSPEVQGNFTKDMQNIAYNERQFSDNIFGEIHPDNMHWNKTVAKGLKGLIAYPGWNIGTLRWMTGMARGAGKLVLGKEMDFQACRSLEFGAGLIITTAIANTLLHAALNNGEAPDGWEDVLIGARTGKYLNNGQPERITIASYMKDVAAMATHRGKAMLAKMQAPFSIMYELYQNSDYFGTEIIPSKGTTGDKIAGLGKYLVGKAAPFGFSNIATGKSDLAKYGGLVGFRTVPRVLANTPAQNRIDEILHAQSSKSRSAEDTDRSRLVSELKELGWNDKRPEMIERIAAARREGLLTSVQAQHIREDTQKDKRVVQFKKLRNVEDAMDVYEAGTPEERKLWRPMLSSKWSQTSPEKTRKFREEYLRIIKLPMAEKMPSRVPPRQGYSIAPGD
jgi:hypothetical protein